MNEPCPNQSSPLHPYIGSYLFIASRLVLITLLSFASPHGACTQVERDSLLSFLSSLSSTSNSSLLSSWGGTGDATEDCCLWEGVSCNGNNGSVTHLWLPLEGLTGPISPVLANLTHLSHLNLSYNSFTGELPSALLWSEKLVVLDVSFNSLSGDLFIPPSSSFSGGSTLQVLNVSGNIFTGELPSIGWPQNLVEIDLSNNSLTGPIPSAACSESPHIQFLNIEYNKFSGGIPPGLGQCSQLRVFQAGSNNLTGQLPSELLELQSLQTLCLPYNQFWGVPDWERIANLSNLTALDLSGNDFSGPLPEVIGKLTNLERLVLFHNSLSGALPSALTNCTKLTVLSLRGNLFSGNLSAINFSRFSNLSMLDLGNNSFTGGIPESIYSCTSLVALRLSMNPLRGHIAPGFINLQALSFLALTNNLLVNITGAFQILKNCKNLTSLILNGNFIGEAMPQADWGDGFQNLKILYMKNCSLTGNIPTWLSKLEKLEFLVLSYNQLTGSVPSWFGSLPHLFYVDLSNNLLSGEFPVVITKLEALEAESSEGEGPLELPVFMRPPNASILQYDHMSSMPPALYLRNNSLSGVIPPEIGQLKMLHILDLSINNFSGGIPVELCNLTNLETLDLSGNHLSGMIPPGLGSLHFLSSFSVAYNDLQGPIPSGGQFDTFPASSFKGNPNLCGRVIKRQCTNHSGEPVMSSTKGSHEKKLLLVVAFAVGIGGTFILVLVAWFVVFVRRPKHLGGAEGDENMNNEAISSNSVTALPSDAAGNCTLVMVSLGSSEFRDLTFPDILKATNDFDQANIIGCGGFGLVYKAVLANGTTLAIKRLSGDMCLMEREFRAEVEALSMAGHENLVPLQGYCILGNFRLLIYPYMENGSLYDWLHDKDDGRSKLNWPIRLSIAVGASRGLAYIHQTCQPHIVHRDIKSSNILLDQEFKAYVADFGLSRLILPHKTHVSTELVGTLGYIPPEYGQAWVATLRGDIYSFGVVLLELLTGRRPVEVLPKQSEELIKWVQQMSVQGRQDEVFDPLLQGMGFEEQMQQVLDLACMCVNENPFKRPTINDVVSWLEHVGTSVQALK